MSHDKNPEPVAQLRRFKPYPAYKDSGVEWLGNMPAHWSQQRLKYSSYLKGRIGWQNLRSEEFTLEGPYLVTGMHFKNGSVDWDACFHVTMERYHMSPEIHVREGDIIVTKDGTIGKTAHVARLPYLATLNSHLLLVRALRGQYRPRFLYYLFDSAVFQTYARFAEGGTTFFGITQEAVSNFPITLPPLAEQEAIAAFLDRETARIDALVGKKERLIELLQEKRTSLVTRTVTKGLAPNVPMKDSGIEWLGEIPAHWDSLALSRITLSRCDGPFGSGLKTEHYSGSGVRVVRLQNIGWTEFLDEDRAFIDQEYASQLGDHSVMTGDVLIAGLGDERHPVGRACVAPDGIEPAMVKADCFRFRLEGKRVLPRFAAYQLSATATAAAGSLATGATRARTNLTVTASRNIALPPLKEQQVIVEALDRERERYLALISRIYTATECLKELRTALISAAVTGKIDVREAA